MSEMIGKGLDAGDALMDEVEDLFEFTVEQRQAIVEAVNICTDPDEPDYTYEQFYKKARLAECKISGQPLEAEDHTDGDGNPDGGWVESTGLQIRWQRGPLDKDAEGYPWNGAFPVTVLEAVLHRIDYYQRGKFRCYDNDEAMKHIQKAIEVLNRRQVNRFCRGVRNTHEE